VATRAAAQWPPGSCSEGRCTTARQVDGTTIPELSGAHSAREFSFSILHAILTDIYRCHACACHATEEGNAWTGHLSRVGGTHGMAQAIVGGAFPTAAVYQAWKLLVTPDNSMADPRTCDTLSYDIVNVRCH
jgi:hypothetical protein